MQRRKQAGRKSSCRAADNGFVSFKKLAVSIEILSLPLHSYAKLRSEGYLLPQWLEMEFFCKVISSICLFSYLQSIKVTIKCHRFWANLICPPSNTRPHDDYLIFSLTNVDLLAGHCQKNACLYIRYITVKTNKKYETLSVGNRRLMSLPGDLFCRASDTEQSVIFSALFMALPLLFSTSVSDKERGKKRTRWVKKTTSAWRAKKKISSS